MPSTGYKLNRSGVVSNARGKFTSSNERIRLEGVNVTPSEANATRLWSTLTGSLTFEALDANGMKPLVPDANTPNVIDIAALRDFLVSIRPNGDVKGYGISSQELLKDWVAQLDTLLAP